MPQYCEKINWDSRFAGYYANQTDGLLAHSDFDKLALSFNMRYKSGKKGELLWSNAYIDYYSDMAGSLDSTDFSPKIWVESYIYVS